MSAATAAAACPAVPEEEPNDDTAEPGGVAARLGAVRRQLRRLTLEAFQQSRATHLYADEDGFGFAGGCMRDDPDSPPTRQRPGVELELFGQDAAVLERHVQEALARVEAELEDVLAADVTADAAPAAAPPTPQELDWEAERLRAKIGLLRGCSRARAALDEAPAAAAAGTDLVAAVRHLVAAQQALAGARATLLAYQSHGGKAADDEEEDDLDAANDENTINVGGRGDAAGRRRFVSESGKMLTALETSARRQRVLLLGRAAALWRASVELTPGALAVREAAPPASGAGAASSGGAGDLRVAYDALEAFGEAGRRHREDLLRTFTRALYDGVLAPVLRRHLTDKGVAAAAAAGAGRWTLQETQERSAVSGTSVLATTGHSGSRGPTRRLEWTCDADETPGADAASSDANMSNISAWKETFEFMDKLLSFVVDRVLLGREELCSWAGDRFFGNPSVPFPSLSLEALGLESRRLGDDHGLLLEPLLDALSESCIPTALSADKVGSLSNMSTELGSYINPFLESMNKKGLIADPSGSKLSKFVTNFEQRYVDKRHWVILDEARNLLMQNDYHNIVQVGVEIQETGEIGTRDGMAVFKLHKSGISETTSLLMKLCRTTMDESVAQQSAPEDTPLSVLPATLYRTARETLDLFRAIIPATQGYEIKNVPRTAAIFHNDCVFLAHHCLTLGLEYKDKYPPTTEADAGGKLLRQTCMFVDMVPLFRDLAERSLGDMLELQASQIAELVGQRLSVFGDSLQSNEIVIEWSEAETGLTAGLYHLRHLLQAWQSVLSKDILNRSMWYLSDIVFTLYLNQVLGAKRISANACQMVDTLFERATNDVFEIVDRDTKGSRVWDRFTAVRKFMEMSLADVQVALADGVFQCMTGKELSHLIAATFDDSPARREITDTLLSR